MSPLFFIRRMVWSLVTEGGQTEELKTCLRKYRLPQRAIDGRNRVPKAAFDQTGRHSLGNIRQICVKSVHLSMMHQITSFIWQLLIRQFEGYQTNLAYKVLPHLSSTSMFIYRREELQWRPLGMHVILSDAGGLKVKFEGCGCVATIS